MLTSRPIRTLSHACRCRRWPRQAAVLPLFALLLPALLLLAGFAVNVAYMQLTRTELKVATDAAGKAGGRAFSEFQDVDQALVFARDVAVRNKVAGDFLSIDITDNTGDVDFGSSTRVGNGYGRYTFTPRPSRTSAICRRWLPRFVFAAGDSRERSTGPYGCRLPCLAR